MVRCDIEAVWLRLVRRRGQPLPTGGLPGPL